jgi:NADH-quinone oxidoreductase subunit J
MDVDLILFLILAVIAVVSALGMLFSSNAIYSALFLILNFATGAVFYLLLGAPFIAMVQITVYAGAIMVLFLFVIMLLGAEKLRRSVSLPWQQPLAIVLAVILIAEASYIVFGRAGSLPDAVRPETLAGSPLAIGEVLFNQYLLPFEVTSILLLVAMIGAIVLTKGEKSRTKSE